MDQDGYLKQSHAMLLLNLKHLLWLGASTNANTSLLDCGEFIIRIDHRTLIPILNSKSLSEIDNPRVLRLVEKLRPYRYKAEHISSIKNRVTDALSRALVEASFDHRAFGADSPF